MNIMYDIDVKDAKDPHLRLAEKGIEGGSIAAQPGRLLVDAIPLLKYIPAWLPGAHFQRFAKECKFYFDQARDVPFDYVRIK